MAPRNLGASVLEAYKDEDTNNKVTADVNTNNETAHMMSKDEETIKKMKQNLKTATVANTNKGFSNSREEINDKSRRLIQSCLSHLDTNLNVLVLGGKNSGKSSLINSMNMSLTQEWKDVAKICPGRKHVIDECVMMRNRKCNGKVVFWDARGFDEVHEDEQIALILRYVLEGRIPSKCIPCVLLMSCELIKKRYHRVVEPHRRRIDLVLFVSDPTTTPCTRLLRLLQQAITSSKQTLINDVPVVSVVTKMDQLQSPAETASSFSEYDFEQSISSSCHQCGHHDNKSTTTTHKNTDRNNNNQQQSHFKVKKVSNYLCELEPWSDLSVDPASMESCPELDTALLSIWKEIVTRTAACGGDRRKRNFSVSSKTGGGFVGCLPFVKDFSKLKLI